MNYSVIVWGLVLTTGVLAMLLRTVFVRFRYFRPVVPLFLGYLLHVIFIGTEIHVEMEKMVILDSSTLRSWIVPATVVYGFNSGVHYVYEHTQCTRDFLHTAVVLGLQICMCAYTFNISMAACAALACTDPATLLTVTDNIAMEKSAVAVLMLRSMTQTILSIYVLGMSLGVGIWWQYVLSLCIGFFSALVWRWIAMFLKERGDRTGWLTFLLIAPYMVYAVSESVLPVCGVGAVAIYGITYAWRSKISWNDIDTYAVGSIRSISVTSENVFFVILGMFCARNPKAWTLDTLYITCTLFGIQILCSIFYCYDSSHWTMFKSIVIGLHAFRGPVSIVIASSLAEQDTMVVCPVMVTMTVVSAVLCQFIDGFRSVVSWEGRTTTEHETLLSDA